MTQSYPLALPTPFRVQLQQFGFETAVAVSESPYSFSPEVQVHQGQRWMASITCPPLERANAEQVAAWMLKLNGREGTFLIGDSFAIAPRGTWAGTPVIDVAGSPTVTLLRGDALPLRGLTSGATIKAGDYVQIGTGSSARLYKSLDDATAPGTGRVSLTVWPRIQIEPADGTAATFSDAKGLFRMNQNRNGWNIDTLRLWGLTFDAMSVT